MCKFLTKSYTQAMHTKGVMPTVLSSTNTNVAACVHVSGEIFFTQYGYCGAMIQYTLGMCWPKHIYT